MEPTEQVLINNSQRRKNLPAIIVMLTTTGLMWFGFFMLIPLMAVHVTHDLMLGAGFAGLVLAVRQFLQQGLGPFAGPIADWAGYRKMMLLGNFIRAIGFSWLAVSNEPFGLLMGGVVAALGGAGFEASGKAALAYLSKGYSRESIFALSVTCGNVGMALGPLVGVMLIKVDFMVVGLAAAAVYLICFALIWIYVPEIDTNHGEAQHRITIGEIVAKLGSVWSNRPFVVLCVLLVGYYFLYVQINITLPLMAVKLSGSEDSVSLIFALNSGMAIFFQFFSVKLIRKWLQPVTIIAVGVAITTLGLAAITFINSYIALILCVLVYAVGRLLVDPVVYTITTRYATDDTMASYFGFSSLALAFGGMFGNSLGGWLYDTGNAIGFPSLCWVVFAVVGGSVSVGIFVFQRWEQNQVGKYEKAAPLPSVSGALASPADD